MLEAHMMLEGRLPEDKLKSVLTVDEDKPNYTCSFIAYLIKDPSELNDVKKLDELNHKRINIVISSGKTFKSRCEHELLSWKREQPMDE